MVKGLVIVDDRGRRLMVPLLSILLFVFFVAWFDLSVESREMLENRSRIEMIHKIIRSENENRIAEINKLLDESPRKQVETVLTAGTYTTNRDTI